MNSEKVKEIKKALGQNIKSGLGYEDKDKFCNIMFADILILINELEVLCNKTYEDLTKEIDRLESENKQLRLERDVLIGKKIVEKQKSDKALMMKIDIQEQLKDRIAELEEALLDMVVQFCQMGKEGYLHHTFMSAEENAFDVLDIEYGEKVDDVYKRFNEKWGKKDEE